MSRFYAPKECVNNGSIILMGEEAHHILDVMRMREGDQVTVFDGSGTEYYGIIDTSRNKYKSLTIRIIKTITKNNDTAIKVTLAQAIPKKNKMDYIVEKATELGADEIIPIITQRTIVRPDTKRKSGKVERWEKISKEAAKQCGRSDLPVISPIIEYEKYVKTIKEYDLILFAYLEDNTISLKKAVSKFKSGNILIFIGPEGDFTPGEATMLKAPNLQFVSLGRRVLKSDTAGLFALASLVYEFMI